jgi:DNA-binding GntR family transcriptional regulator
MNAPWRPPADVTQSDHEYFVRHPGARHRFRTARRDEFRREFARPAPFWPVIVIATVTRDDAGRPATISRSLYHYNGGRA